MTEAEEIIKRLSRQVLQKTLNISKAQAAACGDALYAELQRECPTERLYIGVQTDAATRNAELAALYDRIQRQQGAAVAMRTVRLRFQLSDRQVQRILKKQEELAARETWERRNETRNLHDADITKLTEKKP